ncbi:MAG TPA: hypothetical protein G4O14_07150 [Anaerolineae bacterium]|nr:hypothetical protein [Anaerolineae bacterium]
MKQHTHRLLLWFIGLALVACSPTAPAPTQTSPPLAIPATMLPTAVPPEAFAGSWAISFEYSFPESFWSVGDHRYGFYVDCPLLFQESYGSDWVWFHATDEEIMPIYELPVYLRLGGLSFGPLAPISMDTIRHEQATTAVVTLLGITEEDANLATTSSNCAILMNWDGGSTQFMTPGEPFQP